MGEDMYVTSMLMLLALLLAKFEFSRAGGTLTYEHEDPVTRELLTCDYCPAGTHVAAHCTKTAPTKCVPCPANHYTEISNYLHGCLYCDVICRGESEIEDECSPINNRKCRCTEGYHLEGGLCVEHTKCNPGFGVKTNATSLMDTECEACPHGSFASSFSASEPCIQHQECTTNEQILLEGSRFHDTVCGSCGDLGTTDSELTLLRTFLQGFFASRKRRLVKLNTFVRRHIHNRRKKRPRFVLPLTIDLLLDEIKAWLAKAPADQLRRIPEMLRACNLISMAKRLEKSLREIQQALPCN